ncbi:hypothetical protein [Duganella violaceipulchra]|uniref:Uncharacterized protein n=1 Tax=Duganella violaceipulchra TaxID=2849652 RepID=A0AA41H9L4_9BURK|nr:hypothetical protein [Duganella violaceicalia]MBV6324577.1 hypothetical protein [Duganella violaceicalia]MCP2009284.1 hypothetical protein [Duganella violaceicalia]
MSVATPLKDRFAEPVALPAKRLQATVLPCEKHWIEIECFRDDGAPMAGLPFVVRDDAGKVLRQGRLDQNGWARFVKIDEAGGCVLEFSEVPDGVSVQPMYDEFWADVAATRDDGGQVDAT